MGITLTEMSKPPRPPGKDGGCVVFGGYELPSEDTETHFLYLGTTGSGKTVGIRLLMQSVLPKVGMGLGYRAIALDAKQDLIPQLAAFCNRERIKTLNPYDRRGVAWDIRADVNEPRIAQEVAYILIPDTSESQPYFANASRHLLYATMLSFWLSKLDWTLADLLRAVATAKTCRRVLERHQETAGVVEKYFADERLLNDVMSTLASKTLLYEPIAGSWEMAEERVALTNWIKEEQILVLGNAEIGRTAIDNINRCIMSLAVNVTLMQPENSNQPTWFFIDEATGAGCLHSLPALATKGRSKNAHIVLGVQTIGGLRDPKVFGQHGTDNLLGQFGNRFFGRIEDPETAEYASRVIGDQEIRQRSESHTRSVKNSSTTTNWSPAVRRAVLASEFMAVPACSAANGLTGLFTTRGELPYWDTIPGDILFDQLLISPAADVPAFIPREAYSQLLQPWTPEEEQQFAPRLGIREKRRKRLNGDIDNQENDLDLDAEIDLR